MTSFVNDSSSYQNPRKTTIEAALEKLCSGIPLVLPDIKKRSLNVPHAPYRNHSLSAKQKKVIYNFVLCI